MKKWMNRTFTVAYILLLTAALFFIGYASWQDKLEVFGNPGAVRAVDGVTYETALGESGEVNLPSKLSLPPSTPVVLSAELAAGPRESLLVKSAFAPMRVYLNGELVFECGQEGSYPSFMNDPPTILSIVPLPDEGGIYALRVEYISPSQRSSLSLPGMYIGEETGLIARQLHFDGFSFLFSVLLLFMGIIMTIVSISLALRLSSGLNLFWLGLFSLLAGIWGLGECDLTAFLLHKPSLLYAMSYIGLFTLTIPFLKFSLIMLRPANWLTLRICLWVHYLSVAVVLTLQLCGFVDFSKSLYWFHIVTPLMFIVFTIFLLLEHYRYRNTAAKRFGLAILLPAIGLLLEFANYWLHFTETITLFFQLGLAAFVVAFGVASGFYIRQSIYAAAEKKRLEYEVAAVNHQLELQRIQYRKMADHDEAKQEGIDISAQLSVPPALSNTQETDLCIIVGNLLENAVEACSRMTSGQRFIRMGSRFQHGVLAITVDNSFPGDSIRRRDGVFLSSKRDSEGTGLSSVKAATEKYGGAVRFEAKDGVFLSSVYIRLS